MINNIMVTKFKLKHKPSPQQQKMLDMFAVLIVCGIVGLIITLLIIKLADIDLNGVTYFV
jgi:hypothetical protein|tara:strand:- start:69 stop:248 length:180 start_codon:yes stop_codon:yes gene_type:complete